jgi:hypothetical protein
VLHKDVEPRNWLRVEQHGKLMLVNFERAEICARPPLGTLSNQKRNVQGKLKSEAEESEFNREIESAMYQDEFAQAQINIMSTLVCIPQRPHACIAFASVKLTRSRHLTLCYGPSQIPQGCS